jgi:hypothetical protein
MLLDWIWISMRLIHQIHVFLRLYPSNPVDIHFPIRKGVGYWLSGGVVVPISSIIVSSSSNRSSWRVVGAIELIEQ